MAAEPRCAEGIEINEVKDGLVAYDRANDRVPYLNYTAALVLDLCTGHNSEPDMARLLQEVYALLEPPTTEVAACLAQLRREGLIV